MLQTIKKHADVSGGVSWLVKINHQIIYSFTEIYKIFIIYCSKSILIPQITFKLSLKFKLTLFKLLKFMTL